VNIEKAIEIKLQWRKDNYPPALADEMNADMLSIKALKWFKEWRAPQYPAPYIRLPGETED